MNDDEEKTHENFCLNKSKFTIIQMTLVLKSLSKSKALLLYL